MGEIEKADSRRLQLKETCERIRSDIESLSSRHKDAVSSLQQKVCPVSLDTQYLAEARHWYM